MVNVYLVGARPVEETMLMDVMERFDGEAQAVAEIDSDG
jgi:hypothetical protein